MVEILMNYTGELRCDANHGPSGQSLTTDAPTDNQGRGEAFSPTDLLATALGSCMMTIMGIRANQRGWAIEGTTAHVEKHMSADLPRRIGRLVVTITLPDQTSPEALDELREAALSCPVMLSIHPDIVLEHQFKTR